MSLGGEIMQWWCVCERREGGDKPGRHGIARSWRAPRKSSTGPGCSRWSDTCWISAMLRTTSSPRRVLKNTMNGAKYEANDSEMSTSWWHMQQVPVLWSSSNTLTMNCGVKREMNTLITIYKKLSNWELQRRRWWWSQSYESRHLKNNLKIYIYIN